MTGDEATTVVTNNPPLGYKIVTHLDLPETDGKPVDNLLQPLQLMLLTDCARSFLDQRHPTGDYLIGGNFGIYWKLTDPPLDGCKAPDWAYIPDVEPTAPNTFRRSYVMWNEGVAPLVLFEFVSGDGKEERDDTPNTGKFWVYRRCIKASFYVIHDAVRELLEVYRLDGLNYRRMEPNDRGQIFIPEMGLAVGHWRGTYQGMEALWVRFYTPEGDMLPSGNEKSLIFQRQMNQERQKAEAEKQRAEAEKQRAEAEKQRAEAEKQKAESEKLRAEAEKQKAESEKQRAETEKQRAETEKQRAETQAQQLAALMQKLQEKGIDPNQL